MRLEFHPKVYKPAEDSDLLAENAFFAGRVLEIGCGCGIVAIAWALKGNEVDCVDINPYALELTKRNAEKNGVKINIFYSNLFSNVKKHYDCILFNPPYLPTTEEEKTEEPLNSAWDGGEEGNALIKAFLKEFPKHGKRALLVISSLNKVEIPYPYRIVAQKNLFFEKLYLLDIQRDDEMNNR